MGSEYVLHESSDGFIVTLDEMSNEFDLTISHPSIGKATYFSVETHMDLTQLEAFMFKLLQTYSYWCPEERAKEFMMSVMKHIPALR